MDTLLDGKNNSVRGADANCRRSELTRHLSGSKVEKLSAPTFMASIAYSTIVVLINPPPNPVRATLYLGIDDLQARRY